MTIQQPVLLRAIGFAIEAHAGQERKYCGEPYVLHPIRVAEKLHEVGIRDDDVLVAALLHDTVEDCMDNMGWTTTEQAVADIAYRFGARVAELVMECTNPSQLPGAKKGNRKFRKELDLRHVSNISPDGQNIKLADLIDNSKSIFELDRNFAVVYSREKEKMLDFLTEGDPELYRQALLLLAEYKNKVIEERLANAAKE